MRKDKGHVTVRITVDTHRKLVAAMSREQSIQGRVISFKEIIDQLVDEYFMRVQEEEVTA